VTIIDTSTLAPNAGLGPATQQVYCGLDCCLTLEIYEEVRKQYEGKIPEQIYGFARALQGPYLEIMLRGFAVDEIARRSAAAELTAYADSNLALLNEFSDAIWDKPLNPRSPKQLRDFFYGAMRLPEIWISQKGERKLSTNREVLEKLFDSYPFSRPFVNAILEYRDAAKQLEVFTKEIDSDGRFRTSYNIAGTETGRPSSSENAFGTGGNAQNIAAPLRFVFVADPGYKLCVIDLEQVEARDVGFFCGCLFDKWGFLDACESGDLHTNNAKLIWPEKGWSGDAAKDKEIAQGPFYRDFSFRDMAKRGGHLSNYYGSAWTAARSLKVPLGIMEDFQARYIRGGRDPQGREILPAYPEIAQWWTWTGEQLQTTHSLTTPFGRKRHFFGRPNDDTTLREAIAFLPQSTTADRMNLGLYRVWKHERRAQLLAQTYDSITFQYLESDDIDDIIGHIYELLAVELFAPNGRKYVVPGEAKTGWNWGYETTKEDQERARRGGKRVPRLNLEGLRKHKFGKRDDRQRLTGLNRIAL
jgi:DNA polymerase I-like protein with 3'-5' exonuclease and polymerase domains